MRWEPNPRSLTIALILAAAMVPSPGASQAPHASLGHPLASYGADEGRPDELLGSVAAVVGLGGDLWAVGDALARTIHLVDGSGRLVRILGGEGDGPGEFRTIAPRGLWALSGGGLCVWDLRAGRVTCFRGDRFDEVQTVVVQREGGIGRPDLFVAAVPEGLLIASTVTGPLSEQNPGPSPDRHEVGLFGSDGRFVRKVAELEGLVRARSGTAPMITTGPVAFSPVAMAVQGSDRAAFTNGKSSEVAVLTGAGLARTIRVEAGAPARERAWRELDDLVREGALTSDFWAHRISTLDRPGGPVPAVGAMIGGRRTLWVQPWDVARHAMPFRVQGRGTPGGTWLVYDWSGTRLGSVTVPDDFTPVTVDGGRVAGIRTDPLGVESFVVFADPFGDHGSRDPGM